jgi:hypothetical protein
MRFDIFILKNESNNLRYHHSPCRRNSKCRYFVTPWRRRSGWRDSPGGGQGAFGGVSGQTPEFDEYTVVLKGVLTVATRDGDHRVGAGQAIIVEKGEWVQYSTPGPEDAEYIAVCIPAFSPEMVHRDA